MPCGFASKTPAAGLGMLAAWEAPVTRVPLGFLRTQAEQDSFGSGFWRDQIALCLAASLLKAPASVVDTTAA